MNETKSKVRLEETGAYDEWYATITDKMTRYRIEARLARARQGNFGDCVHIGNGVYELRLDFGPGWRIYISQERPAFWWLLCGGNKKTQSDDVILAKAVKKQMEESHERS